MQGGILSPTPGLGVETRMCSYDGSATEYWRQERGNWGDMTLYRPGLHNKRDAITEMYMVEGFN